MSQILKIWHFYLYCANIIFSVIQIIAQCNHRSVMRVHVYVCESKCIVFLTWTPMTSVCILVWGQTALSLTPYIRLAIKTCPGPILPHTLATNERWTTSCTMKPLTATSEVAWVIKRGGVLRTIWSLTRSILPLQLPCPCAVHFTCIKVDGKCTGSFSRWEEALRRDSSTSR